jgi:hypothetical protein
VQICEIVGPKIPNSIKKMNVKIARKYINPHVKYMTRRILTTEKQASKTEAKVPKKANPTKHPKKAVSARIAWL